MTERDILPPSSPTHPMPSAQREQVSGASGAPNFAALLADAFNQKQPISLEKARQLLGAWFDESELAYETLIMRGAAFSLTPATWRRVLHRAQALYDQMTPTAADQLR